ncbi:gamma-glutamylcyclotransferase family protein [Mucilaginibacter sp. KACC 22063]|uniref:gamma-glutamylcyclotransferase family protein n=1 Tax=Mucilaginibacter sp. KACC 22063 TaxID=3025666 RepID=UPI002365919C|nr:gamma-glutamylcyclotransferase family protein [Mucilaginibacter sp. KACC 22063]WDF55128.1 gamma-glutamylcyclotransferase [Mucilaginibacter sp. KACC 22063]
MEYLFVYGTLIKDFKHKVRQQIEAELNFISNATVKGALYDLGSYPGFVPGNEGEVKGELYSISNPEKVFEVLDEYEGLHDTQPEYERKQMVVQLPDRETVQSWIYVYSQPLQPVHNKIKEGDYIAYIRNKNNG